MAKTTATFSPICQAKVKAKVFEIVNSSELSSLEYSESTIETPVTETESDSSA